MSRKDKNTEGSEELDDKKATAPCPSASHAQGEGAGLVQEHEDHVERGGTTPQK